VGKKERGWERNGPGIERRKRRMEEKEISSVCLCEVPASRLLDTEG